MTTPTTLDRSTKDLARSIEEMTRQLTALRKAIDDLSIAVTQANKVYPPLTQQPFHSPAVPPGNVWCSDG